MDVSIQGLQDAQHDNLKMIRALHPSSGLGEAVRYAATDLHRYSVAITHVDTGALRASHRINYSIYGLEAMAEIYIEPGASNPRGGRPAVYGVVEHSRGGDHAFYERTYSERGDRAVDAGLSILARSLN